MITNKHIRQYLDKISSGIPSEQGQMPAHVWQELNEYLVNHYERLDKEARSYTDNVFDQLEASIEQRIGSLPEGRGKKTLSRKLSMVRGERPPVWVLYLDTPVIENVIRHALGEQLPEPVQENTKALYEQTKTLVRAGKLICPEDSFHREVLQMAGTQSREGLKIMRTLSQGLSFKHSQSIEDFQIFRALRGFINGNGPANYRKSWQDAFEKETVNAVMRTRQSIVFKGILALSERPGAAVSPQVESESLFTRLRVRYDKASLTNEQQLQQRSTRHLRDLVRLGMRYLSIMGETQKRRLDGFWAGQKIDLPLALWKHYGGNPEDLEGLVSFFESENFGNVPSIKIKQEIWNTLSMKQAEGLKGVTGHADVNILSSVLPYTDIMILGSNMTDVIRGRLGLDSKFDTEIYSADEHDLIKAALKEIARAD
jgi:hypothetical protein